MTEPTFAVQSENFLKFLAAPRSFQLAYPRRTPVRYGYEGRESYGEVEDGLPLLFMVGEDCLTRDRQRLATALDDESTLANSLFHVCSLVRFVLESGGGMMMVMDSDDESVIESYPSGMWQVLRQLSRAILEDAGIDPSLPARSYVDLFVSECFSLASAG